MAKSVDPLGNRESDLASLSLATPDVRRTEEMLAALLESAAQGVVAIDQQQKIVLVNSHVEQMFQFSRDELLGHPADKLFPTELLAKGSSFLAAGCQPTGPLVPATGKYFTGLRKDGSTFPMEVALSQFQHHGGRMALALMTDVTQRVDFEQRLRKSEELYRTVVEDQIDLVARYTPAGKRTFANDAYCRFLDQPREQLIGRSLWDDISEEDSQWLQAEFAQLSPSSPVKYYERRTVLPTGKVIVHQWIDRALFDVDGNVREIQSIGRDVTQQREAEERLRAAQRLESIAMLASGIAHDFNNLLTPILVYAENLQSRLEEGTLESHQVQQIRTAAERAKTLVRQILLFGRKGGQPSLNYRPAATVLRDAMHLIGVSVPAHIRLDVDIADDCGVIAADATELHQILANLCGNAFQAIEKSGVVEVTAQKVVSPRSYLTPGDYVEIAVQDNGAGIPPDQRERIFDPFFSTKSPGKGTGLGLAVVHGTVTRLNGSVEVESQLGKGTKFIIALPCLEQADVKTESISLPSSQEIPPTHVLLVDDDELARKSMQLVLGQCGMKVTACCSGQEALELIADAGRGFDVVLSDYAMPEMSGVLLAERIHAVLPDLPIVLISGDAGRVEESEADRLGIQGFVDKPATLDELQQALVQAMQSQAAKSTRLDSPPAAHDQPQILIVDDDDLVRNSLVASLHTIGCTPLAAANIQQARTILSCHHVDVILVDKQVDQEDGFHAVRQLFENQIAEKSARPRLVGMTGSENLSDEVAYELDAYLTKPFTHEELQRSLHLPATTNH